MANISFSELSSQDWEKLEPAVPAKKENPYAGLIDTLEAGKIVAIEYTDAKSLRGIRITVGRLAHARSFAVEFRPNGTKVAMRRIPGELPEKKPVKHRTKKEE